MTGIDNFSAESGASVGIRHLTAQELEEEKKRKSLSQQSSADIFSGNYETLKPIRKEVSQPDGKKKIEFHFKDKYDETCVIERKTDSNKYRYDDINFSKGGPLKISLACEAGENCRDNDELYFDKQGNLTGFKKGNNPNSQFDEQWLESQFKKAGLDINEFKKPGNYYRKQQSNSQSNQANLSDQSGATVSIKRVPVAEANKNVRDSEVSDINVSTSSLLNKTKGKFLSI